MTDLMLVSAGVVELVALDCDDPAVFGEAPQGEIVTVPEGQVAIPNRLWDGATLSDPPPPPAPSPVPRSVSMRQARLALLAAGLLDQVEALMQSQPRAVQIEWNYASDIWRDRDLVQALGADLSLTSDQVDALFIAAAAIP